VEQWVLEAVTCVKSRHTKGHAIALHFACQTLDAHAWKRGDGGVREEALCLTTCCMMGRRMTRRRRSLSTPGREALGWSSGSMRWGREKQADV
jgi:hypothetical protein